MAPEQQRKQYDLEDRTYEFARDVRAFVVSCLIPWRTSRMSGNGCGLRVQWQANYIEANESLGKKDFVMHVKICGKSQGKPALSATGLHRRQERAGEAAGEPLCRNPQN
jgi:hypothetical protein